ncbi:MAG: hypothetical protein IKS41_05980 [Alphaproteobacteria bacterium]|nr:hypothetical protein [Alphaproteobacteria bacterium]
MGFWSALLGLVDTPSNNGYNNGGNRYNREPTAEDYIRSGEIEEGNYDDGQRNTIDEHGQLPDDW